ncbi:hypothetical protein PIB30_000311 [Stylosanthes scabra]|uniref:Uncharacterized protein n=1 Tax=Stylosanthes scabra TaxID=79078 RepID=A0ABU6T208_9FABA|nr:hypothetical protein [Stylosanthes scabra]
MAWYQVVVSQLHLNGWGLLRTFEWVCLHFGFRPTGRLFLYIYDVLIHPSGYDFISFRARQGCKANPFPWVYWNRRVKDFVIHSLDPLETSAFDFLVSLPAGLSKKNNLTCHWILDNPDAVVGKFLDDLLLVKMKKTKLDRMMAMIVDPSRMAPRVILSTAKPSANPATPSVQVPPPPPPPASSRAKKSSSKRERPEVVNVEGEEGAKEDPEDDLRQKRRQKEKGKEKGKEEDLINRVLGEDSAWEHAVNPLELAFPKEYNYKKALDGGLTSSSVRKHLQVMLPDQLLGESWHLSCQSLACLQIGLESALVAKTKAEEALLAAKDQASVLKVEKDSALEKLSQKEEEHRSALEQVARLDEDIKTTEAELGKAREEANYWCTEWKSLGTEAKVMCQETLEIVLDQGSHLRPGVDFFAINLKTLWDPMGRRIYIPEECPT